MKLSTLLDGIDGPDAVQPVSGDLDISIAGLTPDSREVGPALLFAALPGSVVDGAEYVPAAIAAGARAILLSETADISVPDEIVLIRAKDPRRVLARMAARFYGPGPDNIIAVTGTNGKTSVASFTRQIWQHLGLKSASLGTVGLEMAGDVIPVTHTTPEPVALHKLLGMVADRGVTHLALEASSHGLEQRRLDGLLIKVAGFTNISRDHLDYHSSFEDYFAQKLRLFDTLLLDDGIVVVNADADESQAVIDIANTRGLETLSVGERGASLRLAECRPEGFGQRLKIETPDRTYDVLLPLAGEFQASNALVAAGLVIAAGAAPDGVIPQLANLKGAKGRLEHVGNTRGLAPVFIDYAHTPDALATALKALRPFATNRLAVVFGCGGDRDKGKRPQMGAIAAREADIAIVTDDNPRGEVAGDIRAEILKEAPGALEIGDRAEAIAHALDMLSEGDVLLIAGKGHETGQIIGDRVLPYSDHETVQALLENSGSTKS